MPKGHPKATQTQKAKAVLPAVKAIPVVAAAQLANDDASSMDAAIEEAFQKSDAHAEEVIVEETPAVTDVTVVESTERPVKVYGLQNRKSKIGKKTYEIQKGHYYTLPSGVVAVLATANIVARA